MGGLRIGVCRGSERSAKSYRGPRHTRRKREKDRGREREKERFLRTRDRKTEGWSL